MTVMKLLWHNHRLEDELDVEMGHFLVFNLFCFDESVIPCDDMTLGGQKRDREREKNTFLNVFSGELSENR